MKPLCDVAARFFQRKPAGSAAQRNPLPKLSQLGMSEFRLQLWLSRQYNLEQLLRRSFQIGEEADFFEELRCEVLGLVHN